MPGGTTLLVRHVDVACLALPLSLANNHWSLVTHKMIVLLTYLSISADTEPRVSSLCQGKRVPGESTRKHQYGCDLGGSGHPPCWRERLGVVMRFEELGKGSAVRRDKKMHDGTLLLLPGDQRKERVGIKCF